MGWISSGYLPDIPNILFSKVYGTLRGGTDDCGVVWEQSDISIEQVDSVFSRCSGNNVTTVALFL